MKRRREKSPKPSGPTRSSVMRGTARLLCLAAAGAAWPAGALLSRVAPRRPAGTLILVRHGDTLWDDSRQFTGWADPDLSPAGEAQVSSAAASTSSLDRAIRNLPSLIRWPQPRVRFVRTATPPTSRTAPSYADASGRRGCCSKSSSWCTCPCGSTGASTRGDAPPLAAAIRRTLSLSLRESRDGHAPCVSSLHDLHARA